MLLLILIVMTIMLAIWAKNERAKEKEKRQFIIIGGISLALIATILAIISALVSITVGILRIMSENLLWWWF